MEKAFPLRVVSGKEREVCPNGAPLRLETSPIIPTANADLSDRKCRVFRGPYPPEWGVADKAFLSVYTLAQKLLAQSLTGTKEPLRTSDCHLIRSVSITTFPPNNEPSSNPVAVGLAAARRVGAVQYGAPAGFTQGAAQMESKALRSPKPAANNGTRSRSNMEAALSQIRRHSKKTKSAHHQTISTNEDR